MTFEQDKIEKAPPFSLENAVSTSRHLLRNIQILRDLGTKRLNPKDYMRQTTEHTTALKPRVLELLERLKEDPKLGIQVTSELLKETLVNHEKSIKGELGKSRPGNKNLQVGFRTYSEGFEEKLESFFLNNLENRVPPM